MDSLPPVSTQPPPTDDLTSLELILVRYKMEMIIRPLWIQRANVYQFYTMLGTRLMLHKWNHQAGGPWGLGATSAGTGWEWSA